MKNQIKTILLLGVMSAILVSIGGALGPGYLVLFGVLALAMNLGAYFMSDRIVLAVHRAAEVAPEEAPGLHRMVEELSRRAEIPKPRVYVIPDAQPNAFATGRNPEHGVVAVTEGIMQLLTERELRGVLAHEIAHIKNRDILVSTIAAAFASGITWIAHAVSFAGLFGGSSDDEEGESPLGGLALAIVAPIAATLVQLGISRSREYMADETGAQLCGDPEALASALSKLEHGVALIPAESARPATASLFIVSPLAGASSVLKWFSTHPTTEERVSRLLSMAASGGRAASPRRASALA
ncbi:zinc metalloprotease HtpX [Sorangium sp. So ce296]|uniref:Protease HtpX homolog n=1 Tax=Sorangium cellulosum TaxID=56 RepID=A0A150SG81_SORCE|nr:protease HtpX [Sorangium cellulosum]KYF91188.1 protease HtpX [Sorangium cellulosum]